MPFSTSQLKLMPGWSWRSALLFITFFKITDAIFFVWYIFPGTLLLQFSDAVISILLLRHINWIWGKFFVYVFMKNNCSNFYEKNWVHFRRILFWTNYPNRYIKHRIKKLSYSQNEYTYLFICNNNSFISKNSNVWHHGLQLSICVKNCMHFNHLKKNNILYIYLFIVTITLVI